MVFEARRVSGEYFNKNIHAIDLRKKIDIHTFLSP